MTTLSSIAKLPRPELTDSPNAPSAFNSLTNALDLLLIPKFTNSAARDTVIPSPAGGQHAWLSNTNTLTVYNSTLATWLTYAAAGSNAKAITFASTVGLTGGTATPTATMADLPGTTVTFSTTKPNALVLCSFSADWQNTATSAGTGITLVSVDGTDQAPQINFVPSNVAAGLRMVGGQTALATVGTVGSHTAKLRAAGATGLRLNGTHTSLTVVVFE